MRRIASLALVVSLLPSALVAQIHLDNQYNPVIGGERVFCTSITGQRVAFVGDPLLNDIGRSRPGVPPTIEMNTALLSQLPRALQLFWYGHECAHHVLGHTVGNLSFRSESDSDCWAIQAGLGSSRLLAKLPHRRMKEGVAEP